MPKIPPMTIATLSSISLEIYDDARKEQDGGRVEECREESDGSVNVQPLECHNWMCRLQARRRPTTGFVPLLHSVRQSLRTMAERLAPSLVRRLANQRKLTAIAELMSSSGMVGSGMFVSFGSQTFNSWSRSRADCR